jgi:hypothetical protein
VARRPLGLRRISIASAIILVVAAVGIWVLTQVMQERTPRYAGQPLFYWLERIKSTDAAVSNEACGVLNTTIIPQLTEVMFHDTNDSRFKLTLIDRLNNLPAVQIYFTAAEVRRAEAAQVLGMIGPPARVAVPDLTKVLKGTDPAARPAAALALGQIHTDPEKIIPLLMGLLDDPQDGVPEAAVTGLGKFGGLAQGAVPKIIPLLKSREKEMVHAASGALKQIDPEAARTAGAM